MMEVKKIAEEWCYNSNLEVLRQENNLVQELYKRT